MKDNDLVLVCTRVLINNQQLCLALNSNRNVQRASLVLHMQWVNDFKQFSIFFINKSEYTFSEETETKI